MTGITAHVMIRDEPLVYFAVMSVYRGVDRILLRDTGSTDELSLRSLQELIDEDVDEKIDYKKIEIPDERLYDRHDVSSIARMRAKTRGKQNKATVRQDMLAETDTPFVLIVDGDEIHDDGSAEAIARTVAEWPRDKVMGVIGYYEMVYDGEARGIRKTARLFARKRLCLGNVTPNEVAYGRVGKRWIKITSRDEIAGFKVAGSRFYHYSGPLKPYRVASRARTVPFPVQKPRPSIVKSNLDLWSSCVERMRRCATA